MLILRVFLLPFLFFFSGCAPAHVDLAHPALYQGKTITVAMVKKVEYDSHGRPLFQSVLQKRPEKAGEQFTVVQYEENRPVISYDIVIVGRKPDMMRPLAVVYDWTGKGFETGVRLAVDSLRGAADNKYGWVVPVASMVVSTAAGFVIGVGASVPVAMREINTLITDNEVLLGYSEYTHDQDGRLRIMRVFQPAETPREIVKTEYLYHDHDKTPYQTDIYSSPENKLRTIP
jgi:hypothetical protein